jgi:cold shock CspA family protein
MTRGSVTKLVNSYGAKWGRIRARGQSREVFFNAASLAEPTDFVTLQVGQEVEYSELPDRVNGARANQIVLVAPAGSQ